MLYSPVAPAYTKPYTGVGSVGGGGGGRGGAGELGSCSPP